MSKEITKERLAAAIVETAKEVRRLKRELEKVQEYLRKQHYEMKNLKK